MAVFLQEGFCGRMSALHGQMAGGEGKEGWQKKSKKALDKKGSLWYYSQAPFGRVNRPNQRTREAHEIPENGRTKKFGKTRK